MEKALLIYFIVLFLVFVLIIYKMVSIMKQIEMIEDYNRRIKMDYFSKRRNNKKR